MPNFGKAFRAYFKTYPFILARLVSNAFFAMLSFILFYLVFRYSHFFAEIDYRIPFLAAFVLFLMAWHAFRHFILFYIKSIHIAVISETLKNREIPSIKAQLSFGQRKARERFGSFRKLRFIEKEANQAAREFEKNLFSKSLPAPPFLKRTLSKFTIVLMSALGSVVEMIVAYIMINDDVDEFSGARDGMALFAQRHRQILLGSIKAVFFSYLLFAGIFFSSHFFFPPFPEPLLFFPQFYSVIFFILSLFVYSSFISPFVLCFGVVNFFKRVEADAPEEETMEFVLANSPSFREILDNASLDRPAISMKEKGLIESWHTRPMELRKEILLKQEAKEAEGEKTFSGMAVQDKGEKEKETAADLSEKADGFAEKVEKDAIVKRLVKERKKREMEESIKKVAMEKKQASIKALNSFLEQVSVELGKDNEIEVLKIEPKGKKWRAVAKINGDPFEFTLSVHGEIMDYRELKEAE